MDKHISPEILKNIAADNDMDFYFNPKNIPDQKFVIIIYSSFETNSNVSFHFERLQFFNIIWRQYHFIAENIDYPHKCVSNFKDLPLSHSQKRILLGWLLTLIRDKSISNVDNSKQTIVLLWGEFIRGFNFSKSTINSEGVTHDFFNIEIPIGKLIALNAKQFYSNNIRKPLRYIKSTLRKKTDIEKKTKELVENPSLIKVVKKQFPRYLLHKQNAELALALKSEFNTENGKQMRLLLEAMQLNNPPLIIIGNRQGKEIYRSLCEFFARDIGTYQGVFNYKVQHLIDKPDLDSLAIRLNNILKKIENR